MFAIDTETTGLDLKHGAGPFFVTICYDDLQQTYWEWDVDPITRQPIYPEEDLRQISDLLLNEDKVVGQNLKFDARALATIGVPVRPHLFPFNNIEDTLIAGHLLYSNLPHDLTSMAIQYLGVDIQPLEKALEECVKECRRIVTRQFPDWRIAKQGLPEMPSAKEKTWAYDMWLPRALASELGHPIPVDDCDHVWRLNLCTHCHGHRYWIVLRDYSNADSAVTVRLWTTQRQMLEDRQLTTIYRERMKLVPVISRMEDYGIPISRSRLKELRERFSRQSEECNDRCREIAYNFPALDNRDEVASIYNEMDIPLNTPIEEAIANLERDWTPKRIGYAAALSTTPRYDLQLPKGSNNKSLTTFCFDKNLLNLPPQKYGKSDVPSLDKSVIEQYQSILEPDSLQFKFIEALATKRKVDTASNYMDSYEGFMVPIPSSQRNKERGDVEEDHYLIYASLNQTGTDTLRMSMSNPNAQQCSKQDKVNLRYLFGPRLGREWYPMDYENLELRIPGYEADERAMIELFEKPNEPPFFGSYHLLNASVVYPDLFNERVCPDCVGMGERLDKQGRCLCTKDVIPLWEVKGGFKEKYASTWYQWIKNAGFALAYNCQEARFDTTSKRKGGYAALRKKLPAFFALSARWIRFAEQHGYVETIPDVTVCPERGYPILCSRTEWGGISPTVPLNYHVQSTAMWCTAKAMVRVDDFFSRLNRGEVFEGRKWQGGYHLVLQVHDELVPDCPAPPRKWTEGPGKGKPAWHYNWPIIRHCQQLMEESGNDIGIPLKVAVSYCPTSWDSGEKCKQPK